jgi:hypothetical protein
LPLVRSPVIIPPASTRLSPLPADATTHSHHSPQKQSMLTTAGSFISFYDSTNSEDRITAVVAGDRQLAHLMEHAIVAPAHVSISVTENIKSERPI